MTASLLGTTEGSVPAVFRAKQLLSDTVASLPMQELRGKVVVPDPPEILASPDPTITYHEFMTQGMHSLLDHGNCFLWIKTRDKFDDAKSVYVLDFRDVEVNWDRNRIYRVYGWRRRNMIPDKDILHISINREAGELLGMGPIEAAANTALQTARAEEVLARTMTEDNFTPSLVLKMPQTLDNTEAQKVLDTAMATREKGGRKRPWLVGGGGEIEQVTFSPHDAEWIEGRNFTVQQIGRLFGLHGFFLLVDSGSSLTYSTTESLFRLFLTATLRPTYLERIEQSFSRLLPTGSIARFNTDEILRADIEARYRAYAISLDAGFMLINEVRQEEGRSALPAEMSAPKQLAEIIQKIYLGVGVVISKEEARALLVQAGATLIPGTPIQPEAPQPAMNGASR